MATAPSALPPTTIRSSTPISQSAAHDFLAAYLDRANTDPAMQPNAGISEHGPVSRSTAAAPNLILHNLKRVQAGLAGEVLGRDLSIVGEEGTVQPPGADNGDWQDAKKFEQEVNGDEQQDSMEVDAVQQELNEDDGAGGLDKEERKRKKKERRLAEKKAKANNAA
ncbi:uncharacterized protein KD926_001118 [Aspergillus affinis]|uniref:uncharacterized protein n=1 Tax=Aspergillus affinis TaxID=1070780 RepID=UPI0022FEA608|nr:uncharacterized protein KD926_001118 [Aspergillus affinis]KAI9036948.1 hypothetical protein KD926_001118 [Aspergillus affinis]